MIENDFKNALAEAGLPTKDRITADGQMHRFHVEGDKPRSKNGWYVTFGDGIPAGAFGSWKTGQRHTWCAKHHATLSDAERKAHARRMEAAFKARQAEQERQRIVARERATAIWKAASPAPDNHPYLMRKGVRNHGLRLHKDALVIPMRDSTGNLNSLQFIDAEGNKRFLSGGQKKGCYFAIGWPAESLCIAEGYATAASIHEATGLPVAAAFDAGNLEAVAKALRAKFPTIEITLCADNDINTEGNPGLTKAREAAAAIGGLLAVPGAAQ